jgi:flagellar hook-length control protein FliK
MSITPLSSTHAVAGLPGKGAAPADATQAPALDFGALLGAGLDPGPGATDLAAVPGAIPATAGDESATEPGSDPAAVLDAIAAAQDAAPQATAAPLLPAMAPVNPPPTAARAGVDGKDSDRPAVAAKSARPVPHSADKADRATDAQAPRAEAAVPARFEPVVAAARQAAGSERGAAGELRAEILAKSVPDSQAATHLLHAQQPRHAHEPAAFRLDTLQPPMGTPAWNDGVADRVTWMAKNDIQTAELRLNPADLGPIEITLTLGGDDKSQATVQFSAAHAATREAIETALPRLREMLQENGITLGQAGVDANNSRAPDGGGERQSQGNPAAGRGHGGAAVAESTPLPASALPRSQGRGLVDTFA